MQTQQARAEGGAATPMEGYFGAYGGAFVPETLRPSLIELESWFQRLSRDNAFLAEYRTLLETFVGRPTGLHHAANLSRALGCEVYLKREDLAHTGAHKINNALGQALLAKRMGKRRIVAETGAGQHGVAVAAACAMVDLECVIYMGSTDMARQAANVRRMELFGADVRAVDRSCKTLKSAINEAIREWLGSSGTTHYLLGSVVGPHPFPTIVRSFQSVIGEETKEQLSRIGRKPDAMIACVGGGSNSIGFFAPFLDSPEVRLIGVEAGGAGTGAGEHSIRLGPEAQDVRVGVMQGCKSLVIQSPEGQILGTHSVAPGLDYVMIGPEHAALRDSGRVEYIGATDMEALSALRRLARQEGILCALESAHAVAGAIALAESFPPNGTVVVNISGRGDKDLDTIFESETA
jgi:tryptophan synthase beta chain